MTEELYVFYLNYAFKPMHKPRG